MEDHDGLLVQATGLVVSAAMMVQALKVFAEVPDMPFLMMDDEELLEEYGDPDDPEAKAYIPPGWETCYLWRAPDLWFQQNWNWVFETTLAFAALRAIDLAIIGGFGYSAYTSIQNFGTS